MKRLIYIAIFLPLLLQFCTTDIEPVEELDGKDTVEWKDSIDKDSVGNIIPRRPFLILGDTARGMVVTVFEKPDTLKAPYSNASAKRSLDINHDGQPDFEINCYIRSRIMGLELSSSIRSLDSNAYILSVKTVDTTFYSFKTDTIHLPNHTEIHNITTLDNINSQPSDSIHSIYTREYPKAFNANDSIALTDQWVQGLLYLRSTGSTPPPGNSRVDPINHITYYTYTNYNFLYGTWPSDSICYMGIRIKDQLGWIKLKLISTTEVVIYEYALQK